MRTLPGNPVFRISCEQRLVHHYIQGVSHTAHVWSAVLYTVDKRAGKVQRAVRAEAAGVTYSDAVITLVRSWRLPC